MSCSTRREELDSVNVSTPDHMHAPIAHVGDAARQTRLLPEAARADIYETRMLTKVAREKKLVTQMGIQIHSHKVYRQAVALVQSGAIGKVKEVHTWSSKKWGDTGASARHNGPGPGRPQLGPLARACVPTAAVRQGLLSSRQLAQAARFRHRHVRRHGLPYPRPGVRGARADLAHLAALGRAGAGQVELVDQRAHPLRLSRHEIHRGQERVASGGTTATSARHRRFSSLITPPKPSEVTSVDDAEKCARGRWSRMIRDRSSSARKVCCTCLTTRRRGSSPPTNSRTTRCRSPSRATTGHSGRKPA